ncbi:MAG TPA: autotransporter outer membrane beta-barrel domain-containing protein [Gammaproteobacteria bacterium]
MRQSHRLFLLSGSFIITTLVLPAWAQKPDDNFREYIRVQCETNQEFTSVFENFRLCVELFAGSAFGSNPTGRDNIIIIDTPPATTGSTTVKNRFEQIRVGNQGAGTISAGDGDDFGLFNGGFGFFATDMSGDTERTESELENGFASDQNGSAFGLDYRFSNFILGVTVGSIDNDVVVAGGGSRLQSDGDSEIIYGTWAITDNLSLDIYSGSMDTDMDIVRNIEISSINTGTGEPNTISGVATGSTRSEQDLEGLSLNYDHYFGAWVVGAFIGLDSVDTETDGYEEEGRRNDDPASVTGLELRYPALQTESKTRSLGVRLSYSTEFGWGTLAPSLKLTSVRESEAKGQQIDIRLRASPDTVPPFSVATDDADSSYMLVNFGITALMMGGNVQIFLDYEKNSGDRYLDTTFTTLGVLVGF